jgi:hypothetical protein
MWGDDVRSCFFIFEEQNKNVIKDFLSSCCGESHDEKQWNILKNGAGLLYISIYPAEKLFNEIENNTHFYKTGNMQPPLLCCQIDVSGRYDGTPEIIYLFTRLFDRVKGYAMDDYTDYFWSFEEIKNNVLVEGHRFFDFSGR